MKDIFDLIKDSAQAARRFITSRLLWIAVLTSVLFYLLFVKLFDLQIVLFDTYKAAPPPVKTVTVPLFAPRGEIFDRFGRPLAVNVTTYTLVLDTSVPITNDALLALANLLEKNGEQYADTFPISETEPFVFTWPDNSSREWRESRWKNDMTVANPETATARESFDFLRRQFGIDPALSNADARKILNFRCMIYMQRYEPGMITLAHGVGLSTLAAVEEENSVFTGLSFGFGQLREYPQGIYFSHILGYTGVINDSEYEANKDNGYSSSDIIGKTGLERSMENLLRGKAGSQTMEVYSFTGRRTGSDADIVPPQPGAKIFLTLDAYLQQQVYEILYAYLRDILISKLQGVSNREAPVTAKQVCISFIRGNHIPLNMIMDAPRDGDAYALRKYVTDRFPEADVSKEEDAQRIRRLLTDGIEADRIRPASVLLSMIDLGLLTDSGSDAERLRTGGLSALNYIVQKLRSGEITPQMTGADPCTGAVVVLNLKGEVLASVTYPSYDNNRLVNNMDIEYYYQINRNDPTTPMVNRPFQEARAPGSTFKMITAVAGLETGAITSTSTIYDERVFTKAGEPYTRCTGSHSQVSVMRALQVSCNYFFCETAWRLGNERARPSTRIEGINVLNSYMRYFGLNEKTGVEIGEHYDIYNSYDPDFLKISSPAFKEFREKSVNPSAPRYDWDWYDGDMSRTAIGQGYNNYTPAMLARYFSVIANRGDRYKLTLISAVHEPGVEMARREPVPDRQGLRVSGSTWDAVINGMKLVTEGAGTASSVFRDFPVKVAGKTGTAQQTASRPDHYSFGCFAPSDDPQIVVYVSLPFGDSRVYTSPSARIARDVIAAYFNIETNNEEKNETDAEDNETHVFLTR
ncbi:MAG: penicillin-binding transpeptidase domain-containing protein [Defluviitaleaceae bacterium]|nr:penicillin-binding transpeptidase domain-containing protein [Defluviitaleaceae bacterium]